MAGIPSEGLGDDFFEQILAVPPAYGGDVVAMTMPMGLQLGSGGGGMAMPLGLNLEQGFLRQERFREELDAQNNNNNASSSSTASSGITVNLLPLSLAAFLTSFSLSFSFNWVIKFFFSVGFTVVAESDFDPQKSDYCNSLHLAILGKLNFPSLFRYLNLLDSDMVSIFVKIFLKNRMQPCLRIPISFFLISR